MGLALVMLGGCVLSPGMHLNESGMQESQQASDERVEAAEVRLIPITGSLIAHQLTEYKHGPSRMPSEIAEGPESPYIYRVAPQDVLQITVWDHPELTMPAGQYRAAADTGNLVREDGTIFYPYIGVVKVSGLTVEEIRQLLTERLAGYIRNPQVDVRVAAFRSQKVYVTGEVMKPGVIPITDQPLTVLDALNLAGGGTSLTQGGGQEADLSHVTLNRMGEIRTIDVLALLHGGDVSQNIRLQDGDVLHVPDNSLNKVFVLGEVNKPSSLPIHQGHLSLIEAIGDVGGFDMTAANPGKVYVIRSAVGVKDGVGNDKPEVQVFRLDANSPDALVLADQFALQPRDVVYISTAEVVRWGRLLGQLTSTIQAIALARAITR